MCNCFLTQSVFTQDYRVVEKITRRLEESNRKIIEITGEKKMKPVAIGD